MGADDGGGDAERAVCGVRGGGAADYGAGAGDEGAGGGEGGVGAGDGGRGGWGGERAVGLGGLWACLGWWLEVEWRGKGRV